jgi:hypothetical protein
MKGPLSLAALPGVLASSLLALAQILLRSGCNISIEVSMLAFSASGGIPSEPAALLDLRDLMALVMSVLLGALVVDI